MLELICAPIPIMVNAFVVGSGLPDKALVAMYLKFKVSVVPFFTTRIVCDAPGQVVPVGVVTKLTFSIFTKSFSVDSFNVLTMRGCLMRLPDATNITVSMVDTCNKPRLLEMIPCTTILSPSVTV